MLASGFGSAAVPCHLRDYTVGESGMNCGSSCCRSCVTEQAPSPYSRCGQSFEGDLSFLQLPIGFIIGRILVIGCCYGLFQGNILTAYQVLGERLGIPTRRAASAIFLLHPHDCRWTTHLHGDRAASFSDRLVDRMVNPCTRGDNDSLY